eukprot:CAMPEP_0176338354 /NCGR_PEP_ID=MMETSP0121_2-20121125/80095_1 /TAXON_ID=160619 /ORGANISM="Kryptoperidinium foliaceum, Strain CCMP 1326" /LENGTH=83 /DNA_ID=CAMNT_0017681373 /DNA_START=142 /DNA_END=389 /DNA_ORIENTATION=+
MKGFPEMVLDSGTMNFKGKQHAGQTPSDCNIQEGYKQRLVYMDCIGDCAPQEYTVQKEYTQRMNSTQIAERGLHTVLLRSDGR